MLLGNAITMLGLASVLFSGLGGGINIGTLAVGSFLVIIGVIAAFNQIKEKDTDKAQEMR